jgi:NAD(P)-dependent dehydrogenase (short-subunit alcohol dehydrogenase family)
LNHEKESRNDDCGENSYQGSGRLTGKKAIITGSNSGIGRAVAITFAREGADVLISYLKIEDAARSRVLVSADLSAPAHCRSVVNRP